jgi:hypothetical protein
VPGLPSAVESLIAQHFPHLVEDIAHILEIRKAGAAVILPSFGIRALQRQFWGPRSILYTNSRTHYSCVPLGAPFSISSG